MKKLLLVIVLILTTTQLYADSSITFQSGIEQTPNSNYGNGLESIIRYEHTVYGDISLGLEGSYHGATSHNSDTSTYGEMSGWGLLLEPIYHIPISTWKLKLYILGGIGWSWWNFDRSEDLINKEIEVKLGNSLAYKVGIGADYPIRNSWFLNMEYSYFGSWVPKESYYSTTREFANVVSSDKNLGQGENILTLGIKYKW